VSGWQGKPSPRYQIGPDIDLDHEVVRDSAGERITEARAREMADYPLEWAGRGRPSLTGRRGETPTLTLRVDASTREELERIAADEDKSLSEIVRQALSEYIARCQRPSRRVAEE